MSNPTPPASPEAGWYKTEDDRERWWDGTAWGDQYRAAAAAPAPIAPAASAPWKNSAATTALVCGIIALVLVFLPFGGLFFVLLLVLSLVAIGFGILGWVRAARRKPKAPVIIGISGLVFGVLALILGFSWTLARVFA